MTSKKRKKERKKASQVQAGAVAEEPEGGWVLEQYVKQAKPSSTGPQPSVERQPGCVQALRPVRLDGEGESACAAVLNAGC